MMNHVPTQKKHGYINPNCINRTVFTQYSTSNDKKHLNISCDTFGIANISYYHSTQNRKFLSCLVQCSLLKLQGYVSILTRRCLFPGRYTCTVVNDVGAAMAQSHLLGRGDRYFF
jgi:hypothetical protein